AGDAASFRVRQSNWLPGHILSGDSDRLPVAVTARRRRPSTLELWCNSQSSMLRLIQEIHRNRELIWTLALKELRVRYKRSALGFFWSLLNPLMMMIVLTVVFSHIMRVPVASYPVFLISMLLRWTFFGQALAYSAESIVGNADLLKKVRITK